MNSYIITFKFSDTKDCNCKKEAIDYVESFQYNTKLFDNTYQVFSNQDLPEIFGAISEKLSPDDKMIIAHSISFRGKNIPNI